MIPKIIHYCWLSGDAVPKSLQECMASWVVHLSGYEMMCWDADRFDVGSSVWVAEAFAYKKYAFAADYIRLYALYHYGGIYLDMDVEVLRPFDDLLDLETMICFENSGDKRLEVAAFGVERHSPWVKACLDYYEGRHFVMADNGFDTKVLPIVIRDVIAERGYSLCAVDGKEAAFGVELTGRGIPVFPYTFFSPKSYSDGRIYRNKNTYSVHHFSGSWKPWYSRMEMRLCKMLGLRYRDFLYRKLSK